MLRLKAYKLTQDSYRLVFWNLVFQRLDHRIVTTTAEKILNTDAVNTVSVGNFSAESQMCWISEEVSFVASLN